MPMTLSELRPRPGRACVSDRAHWALRVVSELDRAMHTIRGRRVRKRPATHLRAAIKAMGYVPVPFGDGDAKTGAPGMYRGVGVTCPDDCSHHPANDDTCYAGMGRVGIHQGNAWGASVEATVVTAGATMVWAYLTGRVSRLEVSGDFGVDDGDPLTGSAFDHEYARLLMAMALAVRKFYGLPATHVLAWTYTGFSPSDYDVGLALTGLACAGIQVRLSGHLGENGAITAPFDAVPSLRKETDTPIAKCPAQLRDVSCIECKLCWERPDLVIAFDPHGAKASKAVRAFEERRVRPAGWDTITA